MSEEKYTELRKENKKRVEEFHKNFDANYQKYLQSNGYEPSEEHWMNFYHITYPKVNTICYATMS